LELVELLCNIIEFESNGPVKTGGITSPASMLPMLRFSFINIKDCGAFLLQSPPIILTRKRDRKIQLYKNKCEVTVSEAVKFFEVYSLIRMKL